VFGIVLALYLVCLLVTLFSAKEPGGAPDWRPESDTPVIATTEVNEAQMVDNRGEMTDASASQSSSFSPGDGKRLAPESTSRPPLAHPLTKAGYSVCVSLSLSLTCCLYFFVLK